MRVAAFYSCLIAATLIGAAPVLAEDACPVGEQDVVKAEGYGNAVKQVLSDSQDCAKAFQLLEACQLGTSGDNALAEIVRGKCEPAFLPQAKPAVKKAYQDKLDRCRQIAEDNSGSMYQSFAAVCQARAARDFAGKASGQAKGAKAPGAKQQGVK
jgi:hypothetical protein